MKINGRKLLLLRRHLCVGENFKNENTSLLSLWSLRPLWSLPAHVGKRNLTGIIRGTNMVAVSCPLNLKGLIENYQHVTEINEKYVGRRHH